MATQKCNSLCPGCDGVCMVVSAPPPSPCGRGLNMVTRSPRGRAFQDIVIQSFECKLAETVGFFIVLDLFELDAELL